MSKIKPLTFETLVSDQVDRIQRKLAPKGSNLIMDWINDHNAELEKNH